MLREQYRECFILSITMQLFSRLLDQMQQDKILIDKDLWMDPYTMIVDSIKYLLQQF